MFGHFCTIPNSNAEFRYSDPQAKQREANHRLRSCITIKQLKKNRMELEIDDKILPWSLDTTHQWEPCNTTKMTCAPENLQKSILRAKAKRVSDPRPRILMFQMCWISWKQWFQNIINSFVIIFRFSSSTLRKWKFRSGKTLLGRRQSFQYY